MLPVRVFLQSYFSSPFSFFSFPLSMQSSEGGSDTTTSVAALRTSSSAQAPVVQPVPASQQVGHYLYPAATVMTGQMGKVCNGLTAPSCFLPKYKRLVILEPRPAPRYISACAWCLKQYNKPLPVTRGIHWENAVLYWHLALNYQH